MLLTNKYGLPEPVLKAIENDSYNAGDSDITVTQLIAPVQVVELSRRHKDELSEDASGRLWATYGQLMHGLLERGVKDNPRYLTENRIFHNFDGWKVSGQFDLYDKQENILYDYKFVGGFAVKMALREGKIEWEQQLNLLKYLFYKQHGIVAQSVAIVGIVRDWTERSEKEGVPPVAVIPFPSWDITKAESFLRERITLFKGARDCPDDLLPECSDEERWFRNGKNARCERFCPAKGVCNQYKSYQVKEKTVCS